MDTSVPFILMRVVLEAFSVAAPFFLLLLLLLPQLLLLPGIALADTRGLRAAAELLWRGDWSAVGGRSCARRATIVFGSLLLLRCCEACVRLWVPQRRKGASSVEDISWREMPCQHLS